MSDCVVHRVGGYPLVGAAMSVAGKGLETAKATGYGVGTAATWAEWIASKGLGVGQRMVDTPTGKSLSQALANRLPAIEATVPALTMTPEQIKSNYYEGSRVASVVGTAGNWVAAGKKTAVAVGDGSVDKTLNALHSSIDLLNALLDRTEHFVDEKLAPANYSASASSEDHDYAKATTLSGRLATILAKTSMGLRERLPELRMPEVPRMRELGKAADGAVASVTELGTKLKNRAASVWVGPEAAAVGLVKLLLSISSSLSAKALVVCPKPLYQPQQRVSAYLAGLQKEVGESEKLGEVGSQLWEEVKAGKEVLEAGLVSALDTVSDAPPLAWITGKGGKPKPDSPPPRFPGLVSSDAFVPSNHN